MSTKKPLYRPKRATDPMAAIESTTLAWERARQRLVPVIGEAGFRILFARSLHLTRLEFPWLARVPKPTAEPFEDLQASLEGEAAANAAQGSRALLTTFTNLLSGLIGKSLTSRLLSGDDSTPSRIP